MTDNTPARHNARYIVFLLFLAYAFSFVDRQILSILFEPIKTDLGLSDTALGFLGGLAFAMTYSVLGVPLAMLANRRSRKTIITASLAVFSAMTVLCGMATNFFFLALARVGVGIGEASVNPASQSIVADLYPPEKRSTPLSVIATGAPIGMMFGLIGGGLSTTHSTGAALKVIGIVLVATYPVSLGLYFTGNLTLAMLLLILPAMASSVFLGPSNALMQGLVNVRMRVTFPLQGTKLLSDS